MLNAENIQRVVSWKTAKTETGAFVGTVYSFDFKFDSVVHLTFARLTRAQAAGAAKKGLKAVKAIRDRKFNLKNEKGNSK